MTQLNVPREKMEDTLPPPPLQPKPGDARQASEAERIAMQAKVRPKTIAAAAANFHQSCLGGDRYANNCAHFLSDAFLRAGFVLPEQLYRCGTVARRVVRAREMWNWFKEMAAESRNELPVGEGYWAVFQLNEEAYWGGHVVIIDTDKNLYFGTGNYPYWNQYCYRW